MARLSARVSDAVKEAVKTFANHWDISQTHVVEIAIHRLMEEEDLESMPAWVENDAAHERVVMENKHKMRTMHFKQNTLEYVRDEMLLNGHGKVAAYPPHPDKAAEAYFDSIREEICAEHNDHREEYLEHIEHLEEWYSLMHPHTGPDSTRKKATHLAAYYYKRGSPARAERVLKRAAEDSAEPTGRLREKAKAIANEGWVGNYDDDARKGMLDA